jgi:excinuclease UvrABC nuclease subunit
MFRHCTYELKSKKSKVKSRKDWIPASAGMTKKSGNDRRRVCLQYSIGNCSGPCESYITKTEYRKSIRQMVKLFQGKTKEIKREFTREMKASAKKEDFERATIYRNRLVWLKKIKTIELGEDFDSGQARMTRDKALTGLRDALNLGAIPKRIECYDISNIFGKAAVGSMAVFIDGIPEKDYYRRFEIKTVEKISDTDMIREILERRLKRLAQFKVSDIKGEKMDPTSLKLRGASKSFVQIPDLIIIDGGKGQLSAAISVMDEYGLKLNVVSLAKRHEEIYLKDKNGFRKVLLEESSESMYLVQRIRDEAHRFAITYHRSKRGKEMEVSSLDIVDGVGPKTKKKLLKKFGSVENIRKVSLKDLTGVIGEKLAKKIKENL